MISFAMIGTGITLWFVALIVGLVTEDMSDERKRKLPFAMSGWNLFFAGVVLFILGMWLAAFGL